MNWKTRYATLRKGCKVRINLPVIGGDFQDEVDSTLVKNTHDYYFDHNREIQTLRDDPKSFGNICKQTVTEEAKFADNGGPLINIEYLELI